MQVADQNPGKKITGRGRWGARISSDSLDAAILLFRRKPLGASERGAALAVVRALGRHALAIDLAGALRDDNWQSAATSRLNVPF